MSCYVTALIMLCSQIGERDSPDGFEEENIHVCSANGENDVAWKCSSHLGSGMVILPLVRSWALSLTVSGMNSINNHVKLE